MEKATPETLCFLSNATSMYRSLQASFAQHAQTILMQKMKIETTMSEEDKAAGGIAVPATPFSIVSISEKYRIVDIQLALQMFQADLQSAIHNRYGAEAVMQEQLGVPDKRYSASFEAVFKELEAKDNLLVSHNNLARFNVQHTHMSYMVFIYLYHTSKRNDPELVYPENVEKSKLAIFVSPFIN